MKKYLLLIAAGAIVFSLAAKPASAGFFWAPKVQAAYGFSDIHDAGGGTNPGVGGGLIFGFGVLNMIALEANVGFMYWLSDAADTQWYMIPAHVGLKVSPIPFIGFVGGLGFTSWTIDGASASETEFKFSFYAGLEFSVIDIFIRPQILYISNAGSGESTSLLVEAGYRF